jgi:hypothetical protein
MEIPWYTISICLDDDDGDTLIFPLPCPIALGFAILHQFQL